MIKVTNPMLGFDLAKGEKNPNHVIAGTAINGKAEKRIVIQPGKTANVDGSKTLPGIIPLWVWNQFRDGPVGSRYVREGRIIVEGDDVADKMVAEYKAEQKKIEAERKAAERAAAKDAAQKPAAKDDSKDDVKEGQTA